MASTTVEIPKRGRSSYFIYMADVRDEFKDLPVTQISAAVSAKWKSESDEVKAKYKALSDAEVAEAKRKMEEFAATDEGKRLLAEQKEKGKKKREKRKAKKAVDNDDEPAPKAKKVRTKAKK